MIRTKLKIQGEASQAMPVLLLRWIRNRLTDYDYNFSMLLAGDTGSGKTTTGIILAHLLTKGLPQSRRFGVDCLSLSASEFLDFVDDSRTGQAVVWDESGVGLDARLWQKVSNILTSHALQTFREKNLAVFFCTPHPEFLDKRARILMNSLGVCRRFDRSRTYTFNYQLEQNYILGKTWYKPFIFRFEGLTYKMPRMDIEASAVQMYKTKYAKQYKEITKKVSEHKEKVLKQAKRDAAQVEASRFDMEQSDLTLFDYANIVRADETKFKYKGKWNSNLIGTHLELNERQAMKIKTLLSKDDADLKKYEKKKAGKQEEEVLDY